MTIASLLSRSAIIAACLAILAAIASEGPGVTWLVMLLLALAGWVVTEPRARSERSEPTPRWIGLPRWFANTLLVAALLLSGARAFGGESPVTAFMTFLVGVLIIKLWQQRELRDLGQVLTLSLFLTLGATLNRNDLFVGLAMLAQAPVLLVGAMLFQLSVARSRGGAVVQDRAQAQAEWGSVRRPLLISFASAMLVAGCIGVVLFVVTPRGIGMIQRLGSFATPSSARVSGISNQVDLNQGGLISQNPRVAMSVVVRSQTSRSILGSDQRMLYLRVIVLDSYTRGRWTADPIEPPRLRRYSDTTNNSMTFGNSGNPFGELQLEVRPITPLRGRTPLVHLWRPSGVELEIDANVEFQRTVETISVTPVPPDRPLTSYKVDHVTTPLSSEESRRGLVSWPDPLIRELAKEALRPANIEPDPQRRTVEDDAGAIRVLETWLRQRCVYTLEPPVPPVGQDPTRWFLTTSKVGHCEYFASALAALARSIGIDARVVGGYLTNEYAEEQLEYIVRESDAHAWVEAEVAPGVWRTYDATPEFQADYRRPAPSGFVGFLAGIGTSINNFWNTNVVAFDRQSQARLLGIPTVDRPGLDQSRFGQWLASLNDPTRPGAFAREIARLARQVALWLGVVIVVLGLSAAILRIWHRRRRHGQRDAWAFTSSPRLRAERARILRDARAAGVVKLPHETLAACVDRALDPAVREQLRARVMSLYTHRFRASP